MSTVKWCRNTPSYYMPYTGYGSPPNSSSSLSSARGIASNATIDPVQSYFGSPSARHTYINSSKGEKPFYLNYARWEDSVSDKY